MSARRPYRRPMAGWWRRNPWFVEYMIHEGTALFVLVYALLLLIGLFRLGDGEAAWTGFMAWLATTPAIALHLVLLAAFLYHGWTWFRIMPRTLPPIRIRGRRVANATITTIGVVAAVACSLILFLLVRGLAP